MGDPLEVPSRPVVCECPSLNAGISHTVPLDGIYITALACKERDSDVCQQAKQGLSVEGAKSLYFEMLLRSF